jgi:hypothetical protein
MVRAAAALLLVATCALLSGCCAAGVAALGVLAEEEFNGGPSRRLWSGVVNGPDGTPEADVLVTITGEPAPESAASSVRYSSDLPETEGIFTGLTDAAGKFKIEFEWHAFRAYTLTAHKLDTKGTEDEADDEFLFARKELQSISLEHREDKDTLTLISSTVPPTP